MTSPADYYDNVAKDYHKFYDGDPMDLSQPYPANYFRLQLLKKSFADCQRVLDVGCGDGIPLSELPALLKIGFDVSPKMVAEAQKRVSAFCADLTRPETYKVIGGFDGIICAGVMPHIEDAEAALLNMKALLAPGGKVFVEFRNDLFNLFAMNRLTVEFIADDLTEPPYHQQAVAELSARMRMDVPPLRPYDTMTARYHNPLEMVGLFERLGFVDVKTLWYHYHPALPYLDDGFEFRKAAMAMEGKPSWKSMFICSAFVIEARLDAAPRSGSGG
jgi:SAM-dependent methyltransferase